MKPLLLDTDVMVDILREYPPAIAWYDALEELPTTSCFTVMELLGGSKNKSEFARIQQWLLDFPILYPIMTDLEFASFQLTPYCLSHGVGLLDLLIASVAVGHDLTLATFNMKHFRSIPNLQIIQPYRK